MRWLRRWVFRVRAFLGRGGMERELGEEMAFHLEMEARKHEAAGMEPAEARREALRRFGGVDRFRERTRDAWGGALAAEAAGDVRFAWRQLVRRPGFALLSLATLAVGVGTTAALFGVVQALLLSPLPFEHGSRMVAFWDPFDWRAVEYDAVRDVDLEAMEAVAAFTIDGASLETDGASVVLLAGLMTPDAFGVIGARPLLGRVFTEAEHDPGAAAVAVLSHGLWRQELGGDPDVLGRTVVLDGDPVTVVGVMPPDFFFPSPEVRLWRPLELDPASARYQGAGWLVMAARLRPAAPSAAVARDLERITAMLDERFEYPPQWDKLAGAHVVPLRDHMLGETRPALLLLLGAVGLLLVAACANVAALLLARTSDRAPELSLRAGLGAGRGRLARQLLTEGLVLGLTGGAAGCVLAAALHSALAASIPVSGGFETLLALDGRVLAGALLLSGMLGVAVALVPLRGILRGTPAVSLGRSRAGGGRQEQRLQWALVTAQVMLAVTLVSGATLLVRSVGRLLDVDLGLRPAEVAVADIFLGPRSGAERRDFFVALTERMASVPGVEAVGTITRLPLREAGLQGPVSVEDRPELAGVEAPGAYYRLVTPGAFDALGVRLLRGRGFTPRDREGAEGVAVVSDAFAALAWPGQDPLGRRIAPIGFEGDAWVTVVGVVGDVRYEGPERESPRAVYRPVAQTLPWANQVVAIRAPGQDPASVLAALRREAAALDPMAAVHRGSTLEAVLRASIARPLRLRLFLTLFGGLALLLGMVGVYGVVSYAVSRRTREYGVRMALGAEPARLVRSVVGRGMAPVALGVAGGVALSLVAAPSLAGFLFGVAPSDPLSLITSSGLLLLAGAAAAAAPALRAGRVDPVTALHSE